MQVGVAFSFWVQGVAAVGYGKFRAYSHKEARCVGVQCRWRAGWCESQLLWGLKDQGSTTLQIVRDHSAFGIVASKGQAV